MASLYLVRHAIAAERGEAFPDDTVRPLTRKGRARMRRAVAGLRALAPSIELILTSPLLRAKQTADILAAGLPGRPAVRLCPALAPGHAPLAVAEALASLNLKKTGSLALVGHEPDLGECAAWLVGARAPLTFRKGGVARIDCDDVVALPTKPDGRLVWLATPAMLRGLPDGDD